MNARYLLDTHVVIRWLATPQKLTREQRRVLGEEVKLGAPVAFSAITLLEIALLSSDANARNKIPIRELLMQLESSPLLQILPLTVEVAGEVAALGPSLRDPSDRVIVATARVHGLPLITSDHRIIESNLVPVIC